MTIKQLNAFELLASFRRLAKRANWSDERIAGVLQEAKRADYGHLQSVLFEELLVLEN